MPEDLQQGQSVVVQDRSQGESAADRQSGGARNDANPDGAGAQTGEQTDGAQDNIGPQNLPPELEETKKELLRDYHSKTQKLSEDRRRLEAETVRYKEDSQTLQGLFQQDWFKKAIESEKSKRSGKISAAELTDEQFEAVRTDKKAFTALVAETAERLIQEKYGGAMSEAGSKIEQLEAAREFEDVADKYPDFRKLNKDGLLDAYLDKGYDFEAAYKQYRFDNDLSQLDKKAEEKAQEILQSRRQGAVSSGGVSPQKGNRIVEVASWDDAFDKAWDAVQRGEQVQLTRKKK